MDTMKVTILNDGSFKVETDRISSANHGGCEMLVRELGRLAGGKIERKAKHGHTHSHDHEHSHEEDHHHH